MFFRAPIFRCGLEARSNKKRNTNPVSTKCRLQTGYKMQTENLYCFFVWYVITCHLTTYQASGNRFSAIIFHDYLHYYGIFLDRFLIAIEEIVLNIISSLHIVFSLCARVRWCDVGTEFTNLIKVDVDVNEMSLLNIKHTQYSRNNWQLSTWSVRFIVLTNMCSLCCLLTNMRTETKIVPSTWYIFNVHRCTHTGFSICALHCYWLSTWGASEFL